MTIAIGVILIALSAAFVAAPFLRPGSPDIAQTPVAPSSLERQRLERQKLEAYAAIKEAEFDRRMGKLSDADFTAIRDKYSAQALEAITALEAAQTAAPRRLTEARRPKRIAFCPACGRAVPPRANFCSACGRSLKEAVA